MPIYTCPECQTKLKKKEPVAPGKKLRCPECEHIFAVQGEKAPPKEETPAARPRSRWDDEGPANYELVTEVRDEQAEKARQEAFDPLKERFEKSKRGPALEQVVKPSNVMLLSGVLTCLMALGGGFWSIFPLIFKVQVVNNKKASLYTVPGESKTQYQEVPDDEKANRYWCLVGFILFFGWGSVVCAGASKMHEIEKYWLAMLGSIMAILGPGVPLGIWLHMQATEGGGDIDMAYMGPAILGYASGLPICVWGITTLRKKAVIDGFNEEPAD